MEPVTRLQSSFNKVAVFIAIFQKPKNNLYDTVFDYVNRPWPIETQNICLASIKGQIKKRILAIKSFHSTLKQNGLISESKSCIGALLIEVSTKSFSDSIKEASVICEINESAFSKSLSSFLL